MAGRKECLLGVDLGAGSLKATVVSERGQVLGEAAEAIETASPRAGWSEQDPADWYAALCRAVPEALQIARVPAARLAAVGFSAGAHTQVLTDREGRVIRPAILWSDQRSAAESEALHRRAGERIVAIGFNRVNPTWTLAQLHWIKHREPESAARVARLFLAKDYLRHRVTGDWHTDVSDAVGTLMADSARGQWSAELCDLIDWPIETLPPIVRPDTLVGRVTESAAAETGLVAGTPVAAGSNDTTVELFGAGAVREGRGAIKLATAGVLFGVTKGPSVYPPVSCYPHVIEGLYFTATGTNSCASSHRWLRDLLFPAGSGPGDGYAEMDALAASVGAGAEGLIFHPYLQGERAPYWDPFLRSHFLGLTLRHGRAHFARALYEGIAFSFRDMLEAMPPEARFDEMRIIGGGARSATWRQIMSDVLGREICRPAQGDASYGAALIAGVGAGVFGSLSEAAELCAPVIDRARPEAERHDLYSKLFAVYKEAQAGLAPLDHQLHGLFEA